MQNIKFITNVQTHTHDESYKIRNLSDDFRAYAIL